MASSIILIYAMSPFFYYFKFLTKTTTEWCGVSGTMGVHYGTPPSIGIVPVHAIQPIAAIMKPIPAINLILIFRNPLWYFIDYMHIVSTC